MKKTIITAMLLSLLALPASAAVSCDANYHDDGNGICVRNDGGAIPLYMLIPSIQEANYNVAVDGGNVTMNWLTNQFMFGQVKVENTLTGGVVVYDADGFWTYHTAKFQLEKGNYKLTPFSWVNFNVSYGKTSEITID